MSSTGGFIVAKSRPFQITIDTSEADKMLDDLEDRSTRVAQTIVSHTRSAFDTLVLITTTFGETLDLSYQLMAQGLFTAAESLIAIQTATAAASTFGFGLGLVRFVLGGTAAAALITKGIQLQIQGQVSQAELSALIQGSNAWRSQIG